MYEDLLRTAGWLFVAYFGLCILMIFMTIPCAALLLIFPKLREPVSRFIDRILSIITKFEHVLFVTVFGGAGVAVAYGMVGPEIRSALFWDKVSAHIVDGDLPCEDGSFCDNFHRGTNIVIVEWQADTVAIERHSISDKYSGAGGFNANDFQGFQRGDTVMLHAPRDNPSLVRKPMSIGLLLFFSVWCGIASMIVYRLLRTPFGTHREEFGGPMKRIRRSA